MKPGRFIVSCILLLAPLIFLTAGCQSIKYVNGVEVPSDWIKVENDYFEFYTPPDMKDLKAQCIDCFNGEFKSKDIFLFFEYSGYIFGDLSDTLKETLKKSTEIKNIRINGKKAQFSSQGYRSKKQYAYVVAAIFRAPLDNEDLFIRAVSQKPNDLERMESIIKSIRFKDRQSN